MGGSNHQVVAAIFLVAVSLSCFAQQNKPTAGEQAVPNSQTTPFVGCYDLKLGSWWPWGFGEDEIFATPPSRIKLLPERGTDGFEQNGFLIREMPSGKDKWPYQRRRSSYWQVKSIDQVELTWTTGFSGVTLGLKKHGNTLSGWAHPFWDFPRLPRIAHVTASQIACDAAQ